VPRVLNCRRPLAERFAGHCRAGPLRCGVLGVGTTSLTAIPSNMRANQCMFISGLVIATWGQRLPGAMTILHIGIFRLSACDGYISVL